MILPPLMELGRPLLKAAFSFGLHTLRWGGHKCIENLAVQQTPTHRDIVIGVFRLPKESFRG